VMLSEGESVDAKSEASEAGSIALRVDLTGRGRWGLFMM